MHRTQTECSEEGASHWDESSCVVIARDEVTVLGEIPLSTKAVLGTTLSESFLSFIQLAHRPFLEEVGT